jgi:RND family efflux transporter MFP subunit
MKKAIFVGLPFLILLILVGWRYTQKTESTKQLAARSSGMKNGPVNVVLGKAGPHLISHNYQAVGMVESPFTVELSPKLTGKIVYLPDEIRPGYSVKAGQVLARLDPAETEGQVLQAKAALAQARANLMSAKYIQHPTDTNIESQIEQGNATVSSNQADYDQVRENFAAQIHQAHSTVIDAQAKLNSAKAATYNAEALKQSAQATLANAKAKLSRETTLYKQGFVAAQDVDDAVAAEKVAEANVSVADGQVRSAKSAEVSADAVLRSAQDNESIVKKTGETNIKAALAKVKLSKAALRYSVSATSQKPAYAAQLNALQAAVDAAQGNLNQAEARLSDCNLVSTIDGTVSKRNAEAGTVVNAGNSVLEIQFLKWLYVTSAVPIEYTGKIVQGTPVTMAFDALPGVVLTGTVTELSNVADPQNRQLSARVRIDNSEGKFKPGMYSQVTFKVSESMASVVVPREAVHTTNEGNSTVTVVDSSMVAHQVPVTVGDEDTDHIAITNGVDAGQKVVILSYNTVRDGQKVTEGGKRGGKKGAGAGKADGAQTSSSEGSDQSGTSKSPKSHRKKRSDAAGTTTLGGAN